MVLLVGGAHLRNPLFLVLHTLGEAHAYDRYRRHRRHSLPVAHHRAVATMSWLVIGFLLVIFILVGSMLTGALGNNDKDHFP